MEEGKRQKGGRGEAGGGRINRGDGLCDSVAKNTYL